MEPFEESKSAAKRNVPAKPFTLRLPGLVPDAPVGLGDAVKKLTTHMGIAPCSGCTRRAATLNRWVVLRGWR